MDELNTETVNDDVRPDNQEHENNEPTAAETRARRMGWIPEAEWDDSGMDRRPRKFLSADEYVEKVENDVPILRERNRYLNGVAEKLEKQLTEATSTIKSTNERVSELGELVESLHTQNIEVGRRAYEQAKRDLEAAKRRAVAEADEETYDAAERRLKEIEQYKPVEKPPKVEKKPDPQPAQDAVPPEAVAWVNKNQDIWNDRAMNATATAYHADNLAKGMTMTESLEKLRDQVRTEFPHKFANERRNDPPAVSSTSPPKRGGNKETFESIPADAKQTFERLRKFYEAKGKKYTPEQYAKSYYLNLKEQRP
jgi:uncharacterized protein YoxC